MNAWELTYRGYEPDEERLREALCTLANGYLGTRGAAPESAADEVHYPATFVAGVYNRLTSEVAGRDVENESLVNLPNWLPLTFRVDDGPWFRADDVELLEYVQTLELRRGVLRRDLRFRDGDGRETSVRQRRFVHLAHQHLAGLETTVRAENWSGRLTFRSALDGSVRNRGVERYRDLADRHLEILEADEPDDDVIRLRVRTVQSRIEVVQAARTRAWIAGRPATAGRELARGESEVAHELTVTVGRGEQARVEKVVALFTSRDRAISEPGTAARTLVASAPDVATLLVRHEQELDQLWHRSCIAIGGDERAEQVLNLHVFHLVQLTPPASADLDAGLPARGLHGEAYRGHIFWDEVFVFPWLVFRAPEVAARLLRYRHRRLPAARRAAAAAGRRGAMFPWQSGSSGREEAQEVHLNPESGRWIPDDTHRQRHIGSAIAFNTWQYVAVTDDTGFLAHGGAELLVEIARFWSSMASHDPDDDRYDIHGVVGPDEFHDHDPNWDGPGLRNNAYTNVMAAWVLIHAARALDRLSPTERSGLADRLDLDPSELDRWDAVSRRLRVPFHDDGIISQFEGYEALEELDWEGYRARYGDIHRLDRILEAEGDDVNRYRASKQADVLMLCYLLSLDELQALFGHLGYELDAPMVRRNVDYYLQRTSHGSTLSRLTHSWVLARSDRERSLALFREALESDVSDVQGGTTEEGIHVGAMAGTVDLAARGYSGMEVRDGVLRFRPHLPDGIDHVEFRLAYQHRWLTVAIRPDGMRVESEWCEGSALAVALGDRVAMLEPGAALDLTR